MFKLKCTYSNFKCALFDVAGTYYGYLDKMFTKPVVKSDIHTWQLILLVPVVVVVSHAVARIADHTASHYLWGSRDIIGHVIV